MNRNNIDKKIEDSAISTAVAEMMEIKGKELWEEYEKMNKSVPIYPDEKHNLEFETALNRAYRNGRIVSFFKRLVKPAKYVVTSLAAIIVIFSISVVSVDAFREKFLDWLMGFHNSHTITNTVNSQDKKVVGNNSFWANMISPSIIPEGYHFQSANSENSIVTITYENLNSFITIIEYSLDQTVSIDNEDTSMFEYTNINGFDGIITKKEEITSITWHTDAHTYAIFTNDENISKEQIVEIAENLI